MNLYMHITDLHLQTDGLMKGSSSQAVTGCDSMFPLQPLQPTEKLSLPTENTEI